MSTAETSIYAIPASELEDVDELAFRVLQMDRETVMEDFDDVYEVTRAKAFQTLECRGICKRIAVERIDDGGVYLAGGGKLESGMLAHELRRADEVALYAVAVFKHEVLAKDPSNDVFDGMFYDAWATGMSMGCHRWIKERIAREAHDEGRFAGRGWVPGEGALELGLQRVLFDLLDPTQIGVRILETGFMSPIMSVSGIMGISGDSAIETDGLDIVSYH